MFNKQIEKHVICGRQFDLSMLFFFRLMIAAAGYNHHM
jgi:hypothetical protein